MKYYRVWYSQTFENGDEFSSAYDFQAEGPEHALEQAEDALREENGTFILEKVEESS
jgi:hypothetical protein